MGYNCNETPKANSTILKAIQIVEIRLEVLLKFRQYLGHKLLNLGPNYMGSKPFGS